MQGQIPKHTTLGKVVCSQVHANKVRGNLVNGRGNWVNGQSLLVQITCKWRTGSTAGNWGKRNKKDTQKRKGTQGKQGLQC